MKNLFTVLLIALYCLIIPAQNLNVRHIKTNVDNYPYIISSLQVYDNSDDPITDLKNQNFSASIDGKKCDSVRAKTYKESGLGFNIMLCVDLSGSMDGKPLITVKNAINKFIENMRPVDKLGIMGFANSAELISDFSNDKDYLKQKVNGFTTSGNQTALYYGTYQGIKKLKDNKENVGKILILLGDGKDENKSSSYSENDIIELAKNEGIPVFNIGYTKIDPSYLQSFERISEKTGGRFYKSPSDDQLSKQYDKLYNQVLNIYLVNYTANGVEGAGAEHLNSITVSYKGENKTASNKFIAPDTNPSASGKEPKIIKEEIPKWIYYVAGAGLLILVIAILFIIRSKKKKAEETRIAKEEEIKRNEQLEAEKRKRLEIEKKLEEEKIKKIEPMGKYAGSLSHDAESGTIIQKPSREDRTMILSTGTQKGAGFKNLRLKILTGENQGQFYDITSSGASIGRKEGNTIIIKDETISGSHAKITYQQGMFFVEDLSSSNGTFLNGKKVSTNQINHNDTFKFGKCEGLFELY